MKQIYWGRFVASQALLLTGTAVCLIALTLMTVLQGCNGNSGSSGGTPATSNLDRGARVVMRITRQAAPGYLNDMSAADKAKFEGQGFVFRAAEFDYPDTPLEGRFLKIANRFISIGANGEVFIPKEVVISGSVGIFNELSDTTPLGTINLTPAITPIGSPLKTATLSLKAKRLGSAREMDGEETTRAKLKKAECCTGQVQKKLGAGSAIKKPRAIADGCNRVDCSTTVNDPAVGCCLDFDVSKGRIRSEDEDGVIPNSCTVKRVREYIGTVCDDWVRRNVCLQEQATGLGPFGCYRTHRYRFCQFLNENEYGVAAPTAPTVQVGTEFTMPVTNNTPANETLAELAGDANGSLQPGEGVINLSGRQSRVDHYDATAEQHIKTRNVVYKAPDSLPNGKTEAFDTITFKFWKTTRSITIRVVQKCGGNTGNTNRTTGRVMRSDGSCL